jgi:hypothetical protein
MEAKMRFRTQMERVRAAEYRGEHVAVILELAQAANMYRQGGSHFFDEYISTINEILQYQNKLKKQGDKDAVIRFLDLEHRLAVEDLYSQ